RLADGSGLAGCGAAPGRAGGAWSRRARYVGVDPGRARPLCRPINRDRRVATDTGKDLITDLYIDRSRRNAMGMTLTRLELETDYSLTRSAVAHFAKHGFVKLKNVLSAETIAAYEPEITEKVLELNTQHLPLDERN